MRNESANETTGAGGPSMQAPAVPYWSAKAIMSTVSTRITVEPGKLGGQPCIRGLRITVWDVLGWLGAGMTENEILDEHPDLEQTDFAAVYQYAAELGRNRKIG